MSSSVLAVADSAVDKANSTDTFLLLGKGLPSASKTPQLVKYLISINLSNISYQFNHMSEIFFFWGNSEYLGYYKCTLINFLGC